MSMEPLHLRVIMLYLGILLDMMLIGTFTDPQVMIYIYIYIY